jgi:hypothetical protein
MTRRLLGIVGVGILVAACAPDDVSVLDDRAHASVRLDVSADAMRAQVFFGLRDESPQPLGCDRFADDTWARIGQQPLEIRSLGGLRDDGHCTGGEATGTIPLAQVGDPVELVLGDGSGARSSTLWTMLEPRPMQLVEPADAVLRIGAPFVVRWSHDPYEYDLDLWVSDVTRPEVEILSVVGRDVTAQLVQRGSGSTMPDDAQAYLGTTARRRYDGGCAGFVCVTDSWSSQLPVTLELEPPLPAR